MKRLPLILLALVLALSLTACGGGEKQDSGSVAPGEPAASGGSGDDSTADDGIATVDDFKALLAGGHADAEWYADVTDVTLETMLGAPVLAIHVAWSGVPDDYDAMDRKTMALGDLMSTTQQSIAPNVVLLHADGTVTELFGSGGTGIADMTEAFDLPPAPTTAEEVAQWLETVYGPGGLVTLGPDETWYAAIESIRMESAAGGKTLVVTTRAPSLQSLDASLLDRALLSSGSPLLENYGIRAADGSASSTFAQTLVGAGFLYPLR